MDFKKIVSVFGCIVGLILIVLSLIFILDYMKMAKEVVSQPDKLMIIVGGYMVLVFAIPLFSIGVFLIFISYKAFRGSQLCYKILLWSILIIFLLIIGLILVNNKKNSEFQDYKYQYDEKQAISSYLNEHKQEIKSIDIINNSNGLTVYIKTNGGLSGEYLLNFTIKDGQEELFVISKNIRFNQDVQELNQEILFSELFAKCVINPDISYVCPDAGTNDSPFNLFIDLALISDDENKTSSLENLNDLTVSEQTIRFSLSTVTKNHVVKVTKFVKE